MHLLDLPRELLAGLPAHLRNIEDFNNMRSTCRTLRAIFEGTLPNTVLRLAAASAPTFFSPHPHFLVMATARQVSDWALGHEERTKQLVEAFRGGIDGLYALCVEKAGLTLEDVRRLHLARFSVINPLADKIDKMAGRQWYATPNFWSGGVSEPYTIETEADRAAFQVIIYGELFASTMRAHLEPERNLPRFGRDVRIEFIKYCIPDWVCEGGYKGFEVLPSGPYRKDREVERINGDQVALHHILSSRRWARLWEPVMRAVGPDFEDKRCQAVWWNAVQTQGLEGMELVTVEHENAEKGELPERWTQLLREMYHRVEALNEDMLPAQADLDGHTAPPPAGNDLPPLFLQEVFTCCRGMWGHR
ncbi:hypothetical protein NKR23_g5570 [Pleurostoma richardsiae]|uniref:Uncharacterized protein n=1 Tax=Pleurostoma richardsiae TaxID=41990 RepID=A0AA38VES2_9PEZI|nr:hypothetical protein NKR23_g5570 [Pleurostoma richardsiae]